jgi:CheY-like chemotaxis protein
MTTTPILGNLPDPFAAAQKKKRVLLVDASPVKRDLRAETMRKLGMNVDCAADISEARSWWRADLYNLVLINSEGALGNCDKFCEDIRRADPPQQLGFLVGKPDYIADVPLAATEQDIADENAVHSQPDAQIISPDVSQRWGIMEASKRISQVRSAAHARTRAIRERPAPPRDSEMRLSKARNEPRTLDDLLKEETL